MRISNEMDQFVDTIPPHKQFIRICLLELSAKYAEFPLAHNGKYSFTNS